MDFLIDIQYMILDMGDVFVMMLGKFVEYPILFLILVLSIVNGVLGLVFNLFEVE